MSGIEAYKIGVSMVMETNIPGVLGGLFTSFEKLNKMMKDTQVSAANLGTALRGLARAEAGLNRVASALDKINAAASRAATSANGVGPNSGMARGAKETADHMERAAKSVNAMVSAPRLLGYDGGGSPLALLGPRAQSGGLAGLASGFGGGNGLPPLNTGGWGANINPPTPGGGMMGNIMGGLSSAAHTIYTLEMGVQMVETFFHLMNDLLDKAVKLNTEIVRLHMAGVSKKDTDELQDAAFNIAKQVKGRAVDEIIVDARHMRAEFGDESGRGENSLGAIIKWLPKIEEAATVIHTQTGEETGTAIGRLLKSLALRGDLVDPHTHDIDPSRFMAGLEAAMKFMIAANGLASTNDIFNLMKQAGPAARMMDDPKSFYETMLAIVLDMGGARAGTALTAVGRQLFGGKMSMATAIDMQKMGMLKQGSYHKSGTPGMVAIEADGLVGEDILNKQGIFAWAKSIVTPALAERGLTDAASINRELYKLFSTETGRRLMSLYLTQAQQTIRDAKQMEKIPSISDNVKILSNEGLSYNTDAMTTAWNNMWAAISGGASPAKLALLQGLTHVFENFSDAARGVPPTAPMSEETARNRSLMTRPTMFLPWWMKSPFSWGSNGTGEASVGGDQAGGLSLGGPRVGSHGGAMPVYLVNPGDVGRGISTGLGAGAARPPTGPTFHDERMDVPFNGVM
jgi:hypothetical protein